MCASYLLLNNGTAPECWQYVLIVGKQREEQREAPWLRSSSAAQEDQCSGAIYLHLNVMRQSFSEHSGLTADTHIVKNKIQKYNSW